MKLIVACVIALLGFGVSCHGSEAFNDVPKDHWAAPAVDSLAKSGVIQGYPDGTFKGQRFVTRYEFAVALASFIESFELSRKPVTSEKQEQAKVTDPVAFLRKGGYLPADSPVLKDTGKPVTPDVMAEAFASISVRLIQIDVPETQKPDEQSAVKCLRKEL